MADNNQRSEEESLKRSHSKFSNFKLTIICLLLALGVTTLCAGTATIGSDLFSTAVSAVITAIGGVLTVFSFMMIAVFKR